ncbi:MAG: alpha/beta fold hydrolase [Flavobacteriaceae bacterium]
MIRLKNIIIPGKHDKPILIDVHYTENDVHKPIVVFCHGYKGFKDWGAWNIMANYFAGVGFCFIKFNFSYNGGTVDQPIDFPDLEAFGNNNYTKELDDLESVIDWVTSNPNISKVGDTKNISLIGHSRGGGIATIKAEEDHRISNIISLAGVSDFKARFHLDTNEFEQWKKAGVKYVENGRTKQQMPHFYQFYKDYEKNEKRLTIERAAKNLKIPHLIIHGDSDTSISVNEAFNLHKWNPNSKLKIINGANHVFQTFHPWEKEGLSKELLEAVNTTISFIDF